MIMMPLKLHCNKYVIACSLMWSVLLLVYYAANQPLTLTGRMSFLKEQIYRNVSPATTANNYNGIDSLTPRPKPECIQPQLTVNDPVMTKFLRRFPSIQCQEEPDWVYVHNGTVKLRPSAVAKYQPVFCDYYPLDRDGDSHIKWGTPIFNFTDGLRMTSDFFRASCRGNSGKTYDGVHMGVAYTKQRAERKDEALPSGMDGLSIAILGFDSMSRMSWLRRLTRTRQYFHDKLGAIELEAHNIVGDGTTAVILPMLTGKFEWELPECRRSFKNATTMDKFPFLWREMREAGYLTSWCNAAPSSAPFNWRMLGFAEQPTDFYTRPFYMAFTSMFNKNSPHCIGSRSQSQVWLNYFRDIFLMYKNKRKFLFHFITDFSHDDNNLITLMDDDIHNLVQLLFDDGYLNNTLLILMGDHGARYSYVRSTWSGKLEERLPYMSFLFPDWFQKKYPRAISNFKTNTNRLTTPFDLYETFKDILHFSGSGQGNVSDRGISLFKEIPLERSCQHANIAPHWCACLAWKNVSNNDTSSKLALQFSIDTINNYTAAYRDLCAQLFIANVTMATKLETRSEVLKFKNTDNNGGIYKIDMTDKKENEMVLYQLTFHTTPGGGHFEVTITHDVVHHKFVVSDKEISRINKYGNDPVCILDKNKQIRQYCYCKQ